MIKGLGCDIVAIDRINNKMNKNNFVEKVFTNEEILYISNHSIQSAAGIWASKEAVSKALGCGFVGVEYKDIEILHSELGQPYVNTKKLSQKGVLDHAKYNIYLSISHENNYAMAFAVLEQI